jgi:beta-phosphoglucomutase-like phosphatase (HAD superfamily)
MDRVSILLDVGGVLLDQRQRAEAWPRLVGEAFGALMGGAPQAWTAAHRISTRRLDRTLAHAAATGDFLSFLQSYHLGWVSSMCAYVDIPAPPDEKCVALASRAIAMASRRVQAAIPGVVETVWTVHEQGYPLHTASGSSSIEVSGYLHAMGIRACVGRPYGSDLINAFKNGPSYYARIFADLGIRAADALVVDDTMEAISWAAQTGARTVLVDATPRSQAISTARVGSLTDLPTFLQHLF